MGWEAAERVVHEYDDAGTLVSSRVSREVEWDEWQRSLALAWIDLDNDTGPHGHLMSEATNPTAGDADSGEWHYSAGMPLIDYAARAQDAGRKKWIADHGGTDADTTGLIVPVRKVMARD